ncbi:MAG TPA: sulfurtransferase [Actinomycetota bacterium]|nr:sulfurtransferase [Actinomycetota bacterium]
MPPGPLITAAELAAALASPAPPVVLDCRWELAGGADRAAYDQGHLPGAVFVDLDRDLAAPPGAGGRHPLPSPGAFQAVMRRAGAGQHRPVVAYDQGQPGGAARAWWLLGWFGHPDARVLDGGLPAWVAAGLPLTTEVPDPEPGDLTARPGGRPLLDAEGAARLAAAGVLLDARAPGRYQGLEEPVDPVAGHIPGARNAPVTDFAGDPGLPPPGRLRELLAAAGAGDGAPVGAYCGSGVVAAHLVLALEAAGVPAALYAGSWSDWITDPSRPVATGPTP